MSIDHYHRKSPLEISELAEFDKNIEFDSEEDKRRKRLAYLDQAMDQLGMGKSIFKVMGCVLIPFMIIPLFWPFLFVFYMIRKKAMAAIDEQAEDAMRYWGFSHFDLDQYRRG